MQTKLETVLRLMLTRWKDLSPVDCTSESWAVFFDFLLYAENVSDEDKEYILKLALLGKKWNISHAPYAMLTACFNSCKYKGSQFQSVDGHNKLLDYAQQIVTTGRDVADVMSYQLLYVGNYHSPDAGRVLPLPMQLRKGLKSCLENMSDNDLLFGLNYKRPVTLGDCIKLLHPNPEKSQPSWVKYRDKLYKNIIEHKVHICKYKNPLVTYSTETYNPGLPGGTYDLFLEHGVKEATDMLLAGKL